MLYLLRLAEYGREPQPGRRRTRGDVERQLARGLPEARVNAITGRVLVDTKGDAADVLARVHGVSSYSPVTHCELGALSDAAIAVAKQWPPGKSFRVEIKRVGSHSFGSREKAAEVGTAVAEAVPVLSVDLRAPDEVLGIEIRGTDCYLFREVVPGLDRRPPRLRTHRGRPRFLVDQMMGKLPAWLRALGFDTAFSRDQADSLLLRRARAEKRVLLTQDHELSEANSAKILFVSARDPLEQLAEVMAALEITPSSGQLFSRCMRCNRRVDHVDKRDFADRLPASAYDAYERFTYCSSCDKLYWPGAQYKRLRAALAPLLEVA